MTRVTLFLALAGFALRIFFIFPGPLESPVTALANKADLRNYYWPAQVALRGENPFVLWSSGQSGEFRSDMAPLELLIYVATVAIWNDMRAIQILFAVFDAINIILLGVLFQSSRLKLTVQVFYALGPLTLYNLALVPQDKTLLLTLTFLIFILLRSFKNRPIIFRIARHELSIPSHALVIILAALIASFKWLSVFYLFPLLLFTCRNVREFVKHGAMFAAVVTLAHLPWIPSWLYVYQFRSARTATPLHTSPAVLLNALGLYDKNLFMLSVAILLLGVYTLYWRKRIDISETIALATAAGILWTPDMDPVHLSLVVITFLLIVDWSSRIRTLAIWALSFWVAAVYALSTHAGLSRYGLAGLRSIIGEYGSVQMILASYVLFIVVFGFYIIDKLRQRKVGHAVLDDSDR